MINLPTENQSKSNWQKPGGTLAKIITGGAILGLAWAFVKFLPFLVALTQNLFTLILLVIGIIAILAIVTNKKFQNLVSLSFFMICRYLTNLVIEIDPIAVVEREITEMKKKLSEVVTQVGKIHGLNLKNQKEIEKKKADFKHELALAEEANKRHDSAEYNLHSRQAVRLRTSIEKRINRLKESTKWEKILRQLKKAAEITIKDTEFEVEERKEEFKSVQEQYKAFSGVMSIINGDPDRMDQFCYAMDYMANEISMKVGEMDSVLNETGGILSQISLENGVASKEAAALLEKYESDGFESLFPSFESINLSDLRDDLEDMEEIKIPVLIEAGSSDSGNNSRFF